MSAVDIAYRMIVAAKRLAPYREQITAWRLACESCEKIGDRLGIGKTTVAYACAEWGVKPPKELRAWHGGLARVHGNRCQRCEVLLAEAPEGDGAMCGWCLAERDHREPWREWICNTGAAAIEAVGMGGMVEL